MDHDFSKIFASEQSPKALILRHAQVLAPTVSHFQGLGFSCEARALFVLDRIDNAPLKWNPDAILLITSASVFHIMHEDEQAGLKQHPHIWCVGSITEQAALQRGISIQCVGHNSQQMIVHILQTNQIQTPFVHISAERTHFDYQRLRDYGFSVTQHPFYTLRMVDSVYSWVQEVLQQNDWWVPVYSQQAAEILAQISVGKGTVFWCMSDRVAQSIPDDCNKIIHPFDSLPFGTK